MNIVMMSDTHGRHKEVSIPTTDLVIHTGDWSAKGAARLSIKDFDLWLGRIPTRLPAVLSPGNHEFYLEEDPCRAGWTPSATVLVNDILTVEGLQIWATPVTQLWSGAFGRSNPRDREAYYAQIPKGIDILISHGPPYGILDQAQHDSKHSGCVELLRAVHRVKPRLHVFGHVHGAYGILSTPETIFVNAALLRPDGGLNPAVIFDVTGNRLHQISMMQGACCAAESVVGESAVLNVEALLASPADHPSLSDAGFLFSESGRSLLDIPELATLILPGLHPAWDPSTVLYFHPIDFHNLVRGCTVHGITIYGLEVFTLDGELIGVFHATGTSNLWAADLALQHHLASDAVIISATDGNE